MLPIISIFFLIFTFFTVFGNFYSREFNSVLSYGNIKIRVDLLVSFIILIIIQLLIQPILNDDYKYYREFYSLVEPITQLLRGDNFFFKNHSTFFEEGFKVLNSVFKLFISNPVIFFVIINSLCLIIIFSFIIEFKISFAPLLLAYFSFMYLSIQLGMIRQGLAMVIFFMSFKSLVNRNPYMYFLLVLLAISFHRSAIILLPIYFIVPRTFNINLIVIIYLIGLILYILRIDLISLLVGFLSGSDNRIINKVIFYINNSVENNFLGIGFWDRLLIFILLIVARIQLNKKETASPFLNTSFNLAIFSILMQLYAFNYAMVTTRLRYYFFLFVFIVLIKYIDSYNSRLNKTILLSVFSIYCFVMFFLKWFV